MSINKVMASGNIVRDPELRMTQGGTPVLTFSLAVNDRRKVGDNWEDKPNFIECSMFGARAESVSNYMQKGTKVCIDGKIDQQSWEKDGQKRTAIKFIVNEIELMSKGQKVEEQDIPF